MNDRQRDDITDMIMQQQGVRPPQMPARSVPGGALGPAPPAFMSMPLQQGIGTQMRQRIDRQRNLEDLKQIEYDPFNPDNDPRGPTPHWSNYRVS